MRPKGMQEYVRAGFRNGRILEEKWMLLEEENDQFDAG